MKIRAGFVTNSSSTGFIIVNHTNQDLDLVEFLKENIYLVDKYNQEYGDDVSYGQIFTSAEDNNLDLHPGDNHVTFGDEQGTTIGRVFDYILRDGKSESKMLPGQKFSWSFEAYYR